MDVMSRAGVSGDRYVVRPSLLQRSLHLLDAVRLDDVADLDVVVAGDLDAALEALADLARRLP